MKQTEKELMKKQMWKPQEALKQEVTCPGEEKIKIQRAEIRSRKDLLSFWMQATADLILGKLGSTEHWKRISTW